MAVADADLPVWTIRPNWREGVTERLEWLTDVIDASDGSEQTRALRLSPRREFECTFNPWDEDRSYFELWLHRLVAAEFMVPLWHDRGRLSANVPAGSVTLPFDNTDREFTVGGLALLLGEDAQTWERVTITAQSDTGITISAPGLSVSWLKGAAIYPLRRSRLADDSQLQAITTRVGGASIVFQLNQANDIADEGVWDGLTFEDYPVLTTPPNYSETISTEFLRMAFALDNDHGLRHLADDAGRAFTVQAHSWQMKGRAEHMAFRKMLYRLRGRAQALWLPTFNQDMRLARAASAAATAIHIRKIGYGYTGGVVGGRDRILIAGGLPRVISSTGAPLSAREERLNLATPLGANLPVNTQASFLAASRLNQDALEILHYSDTDGMAECKATFRQFKNSRVAPAILSYPIGDAVMSADLCGTPEADNPCFNMAVFEGWFLKLRYVIWRGGIGLDMGSSPVDASNNVGFAHVGNWTVGSHAHSRTSRPVPKYMAHDGIEWYDGLPIPSSAHEAELIYTYWDSPPSSGPVDSVRQSLEHGNDIEISWQMQHGIDTIYTGGSDGGGETKGAFEYMWWDQDASWGGWRRVPKSDYTDEGDESDGPVDAGGVFVPRNLWPVTRKFWIRR